jgi:hypothetical protein
MNGIQVRTGKGSTDGAGGFTDVVDVISRTPKKHSGWQSVTYKGKRYQLLGGIRTDYFISLRTGISSRNPRRKARKTKRNAPMASKKKTGMLIGVAAAAAAVWYFFLRNKGGLANPLPIIALRDPMRDVGSTGQSYPDRERSRANAVEAAKYLKPSISDAKAKEIADAFMRSGLARSYMQRVLSVTEYTNLQPFRNVVENLTK